MITERHVKIFRNGSNQALRIPKEFEFDCDEAIVHKEGDKLIVNPVRKGKLLTLLETLKPIKEDFVDVDENLLPLDDIEI